MTDTTNHSPTGACPVTGSDGRTTIDFDHMGSAYAADWSARLTELSARCPVAHSPHHDGFWMVSGHREIVEAAGDHQRFSSLHDGVPGDPWAARDAEVYPEPRTSRGGSVIPTTNLARLVPSEADGPMHTAIRRLEIPFFTPKAVRSHEEAIRTFVDEALDDVIESGCIDFAHQFAIIVPTKITISIIGFDADDWEDFAATVHAMNMVGPASPDFPFEAFLSTQAKVLDLVRSRRHAPASDVASALTRGEVLGTPVTDEEAATILNGLTFAATDTTTSVTLSALRWLSANPDHRDRLRADPSQIPAAIDEFLRYYSPFFGVARTAASPSSLGGEQIWEGDRVMLGYAAGNRDPRVFDTPDEVRLDRENAAEHLAFGAGAHRCLGAPLARLEIRIMLERVLARMPDFTVSEDDVVEYPVKGSINGMDVVPAVFTPGRRVSPSSAQPTSPI